MIHFVVVLLAASLLCRSLHETHAASKAPWLLLSTGLALFAFIFLFLSGLMP